MDADTVYELMVYGALKAVTTLVLLLQYVVTALTVCHSLYPQLTRAGLSLISAYLAYKLIVKSVRSYLRMVWFLVKVVGAVLMVGATLAVYVRGSSFVDHDIPFFQGAMGRYWNGGGTVGEFFNREMNRYVMSSFLSGLGTGGQNGRGPGGDSRGQANARPARSTRSKSGSKSTKNGPKSNKSGTKKNTKKSGGKPKSGGKSGGSRGGSGSKNEYGIEIDDSYLDYLNQQMNGGGDGDNINLGDAIGDAMDGLGIDMDLVNDFIGRLM